MDALTVLFVISNTSINTPYALQNIEIISSSTYSFFNFNPRLLSYILNTIVHLFQPPKPHKPIEHNIPFNFFFLYFIIAPKTNETVYNNS